MSSLMNVNNLIGGIVNIPPSSVHPVEACCWDITLGTAGTGLGQLILGRTSSSSEMVPEAVDHVGIIVYGYLYEYGDVGILQTPALLQSKPESKYPVYSLRSQEKVGDTERTQEDFENWIALMNNTEFLGSSYNVVTNSCVIWAIRACQFLEVPYPENWDKICDWASENSKVAGLIGSSGVHSRKVQLKAQAAEAPRRMVNYIKNKFNKDEDSE